MSILTQDEARAALYTALGDIAPEIDPGTLDAMLPIREQVDLDSYDFLQVIIRLHEITGIEIPESDYPRIASLDATVAYLCERSAG